METPPTTTPDSPPSNTLTKQLLPPPLTNGVLKRHHPPPPLLVVASYKECLKNHAAAIGGHAIDGCGEFMPSPSSSPRHPTSLTCAACGCHRNFHRREPDESLNYHLSPPIQHLIEYQPHNRHHPPPPPQPPQPNSDSPVSPPPISSSYYPSAPHIALALTTVYPTDNHHIQPIPTSCGKKRFRTKFTQDQKVKMHDIAERIDWKIQKQDEDMIIAFCDDIGVDKNVFKVWMHNNKTTSGSKKKIDHVSISSGDNGIDFIISRNNHHQQDNNNNNHNNGGNVICAKASSSSS